MIRQYNFEIDESLYNQASEILEELGLGIEFTLPIVLKRIVKDGNIRFMFPTGDLKTSTELISKSDSKNEIFQTKMTKTIAIALLRRNNLQVSGIVTFSSKNKSTDKYWSNPNIEVLENDWSLILNDPLGKKLHLFYIPKNSILLNEITVRSDLERLIDIQIQFNDPSFTDTRSGYMFRSYLKGTVEYGTM